MLSNYYIMKTPTLLSSNVHLYTAAMERRPIAVFMEDECVGTGYIEEINETTVRVKGADGSNYFLRSNCIIYAV